MSLYCLPQQIALAPGSSTTINLLSTAGDLTTPTFAASPSGFLTFTQTANGATQQSWTVAASSVAFETINVTITDSVSGDVAYLIVSLAPQDANVFTGYTALAAIAMVQLVTNEPSLPNNTNMLTLLNRGVTEIERRLGGIRLIGTYPTINNQAIQALNNDVQDILSCSWSTGPPTSQGALVYPMEPFDQAQFMDFAGGFPAVGFGPPTAYLIYRDQGGVLEMQLYPSAMVGQLNVYYRARPTLWTLTNSGTQNGTMTNLDPAMQEAVILWTCARVLESRGRGGEAMQIYEPQLKEILEDLKTTVTRRTAPKHGQVRDIVARGYPSPGWGVGGWQ